MMIDHPMLDNRNLQQILDKLKNQAEKDFSGLTRRWTPPPEGDAGTMLHLIFARLMELTLQRLNQVPEKNMLEFLNTMGVSLLSPSPARVPLTFSIAPGSQPTRVPSGTQSGTKPGGQQPALIFETEDDLTVIPSQIAGAMTIDPTWDRYAERTIAPYINGSYGFTPFVGEKRIPHILYLGDDALLNFGKATVEVNFPSISANNSRLFLEILKWEYMRNGQLKPLIPIPISTTLRFLNVETIDQTSVKGVSNATDIDRDITQGIKSRWIRVELVSSFPDTPEAHDLFLKNIKLKVNAIDLLPDHAFANNAPLDVTKGFLPFGDTPKTGDAFYIASKDIFAKDGADVTIKFNLQPPQPPELKWEYYAENGWTTLTNFVDNTISFTKNESISGNTTNIRESIVNGVSAFWIRVQINKGSYYPPPLIKKFTIAGATPSSPDKGFIGQTPIDFSKSFFPFGDMTGYAEIFYFGMAATLSDITANVELDLTPPAELKWEYLAERGWPALSVIDNTSSLRKGGTVTFTMPSYPMPIEKEVNGQLDCWIRVRIIRGDYGRPSEFVPVDPLQPKEGFRLRPGTGNLYPPKFESLSLEYMKESDPIIVIQNGFLFSDQTRANGTGFRPFFSVKDLPMVYADPKPSFYLGFDSAFPEQPVTLYVAVAPRVFAGSIVKESRTIRGLSSDFSALQWEYFNGTSWKELTVFDETNNLTESGTLKFLMPNDTKPLAKFDLKKSYWIRARSSENDTFDTQRLIGIFLNTIPAIQAMTIQNEIIGSSSGLPDQTLRFTRTPVLYGQQISVREPEPPSDKERSTIEEEEGKGADEGEDVLVKESLNTTTGKTETLVRWHEVPNFYKSFPNSRHYTLDHTTGIITFGNGKCGMIPPRAINNVIATYRTGGGIAGNVPKGVVAQVKSPVPGVASVTNPIASDGGAEVETVIKVEERGPQTLKHRDNAVTSSDLEWLAYQAVGTRIARTRCLPNINRNLYFEPGWVTLVIVPQGTESKLSPSTELLKQVENYLEARAFAGVSQATPARINVIGPGYIQVAVDAEIVPLDIDVAELVKKKIMESLSGFFNPLTGGPNGTGWEFARDVYESEICQLIEELPGVSYVKTLKLKPNIFQRRFTFISTPMTEIDIREGSAVRTKNYEKSALLAETIQAGAIIESIPVKGFKEGTKITMVLDLNVTSAGMGSNVNVNALDGTQITSVISGFPSGSVVSTMDGIKRTRLASPILMKTILDKIEVQDAIFQIGERITVFHPFAMTISSLLEPVSIGSTPVQTVIIEQFQTEIMINRGCIFSTLDNRTRLPLFEEIPANQSITSIKLSDFMIDDVAILSENELSLKIKEVETIDDVVYLDDNFLVYPGAHLIKMMSDSSPR